MQTISMKKLFSTFTSVVKRNIARPSLVQAQQRDAGPDNYMPAQKLSCTHVHGPYCPANAVAQPNAAGVSTAAQPRLQNAPKTVAEYKAAVHGMSFDQLHWCLWNVPGMVVPKHLEHERFLYVGRAYPAA